MTTVDDLIVKYAEELKNAKVGDYTYVGILATFARELYALPRVTPTSGPFDAVAKPTEPYEPIPRELIRGPGTNTGHGHIWARPDGQKATDCGYGRNGCAVCTKDWNKFGYGLRDSS